MIVYADMVAILNFLVDFLLVLGTNRLCGYPPGWGRTALSAGVGGLYAGVCLVPGFRFMGSILWRTVILGIMAWIAFGFSKSALRRGIVFFLLSMALGGIALSFGDGSSGALLAAAAGVAVLCALGFRGNVGGASYIPVELNYGGKRLRLTALQDTGNTLRDPVTGRPVLVVGAEIAKQLIGLTPQQLRSPVETVTTAGIPSLRLIPYHAVGRSGGMLLAIKIPEVKIGKWKGSSLVAFAPEGLNREGAYQALTGGAV